LAITSCAAIRPERSARTDTPPLSPDSMRYPSGVSVESIEQPCLMAAIFAFIIAVRQAREAEKARLAAVYMQISTNWNSPRLIASRTRLQRLQVKFNTYKNMKEGNTQNVDKNYVKGKTVSVYLANTLNVLRDSNAAEYSKYIAVLSFMEELGMLCKRKYVDEDDVFDFMASPITLSYDLFHDYIASIQKDSPANYENAVYLAGRANAFKAARREALKLAPRP